MGEPAANVMDNILAQVTNITTLVGDVFTLITGNAYLCFFAAPLIILNTCTATPTRAAAAKKQR